MLQKLKFVGLFLFLGSILYGQTTIYSEDFTGQNGKGAVGPTPTIDVSGVTWTVDVSSASLTATSDWFQVVSEIFEARDIDGDASWLSPSIDISAYTNVSFSLDAVEDGTMEASDIFVTEYRIDGGAWTQASTNGSLNDDFTSATVSESGLSGSSLEIRVTMNNGAGTEYHRLDNVLVQGTVASSDTRVNFASSSATINEGDGTYDLTLSITNEDATNATTCSVAIVAGGTGTAADVNNYPSPAAQANVTFPAGSAADQTITLTITDDASYEGTENLIFEIQSVAGGSNAAVGPTNQLDLSITDNENAPLPYSQDFANSSVPTGWTFTDFTVANSANAGGSAYEAELTYSNDNAGTSAITSEPVDASGANLIDLSWKQNLDYYEGGSGADFVIKVQTSIDGSNFNDVYTKTVSVDETGTETVQISTSNGAGNSSLYVRWLYASNGDRFSYWRIDDISLSAATVPSITVEDNSQPSAANVSQGALNHILAAVSAAVADNDATISDFDVTLNGSFDSDDIDNFQLFYASSNSFGSANQIGSDIAGNGNGTSQSLSFSGLSTTITSGATGYFWLVADVNASADASNTLTAQIPSLSFNAGNVTNNSSAAGTQTIVSATPRAVLADNGTQIAAANVPGDSSNHVLSSFQISVSDANADLNGLDITTSGTYQASDISNLKLWYSTDNSFDAGSDQTLVTIASPTAAGVQSFSSFNQIITNGSTGYFFISVDFPCAATTANTIAVTLIEDADLGFNGSTNTSGTASDAGAQTIINASPADASSFSAGAGSSEANLSWTNPSCFDEVIVVAHTATISGTPSGSGYTANSQDYTDANNPSFPTAGSVVYNGTGTSTTITGLSNGTQYFFKVFARKGSNWSTGVEDNATPSSGIAVFINEMSQGSGGSKEWIEIVVTENGTDLRGWDIGDNDDGSYSEFLEFSTDNAWSNVDAGTVIAIYNGADVDGTITADSDFSDHQVTIASNNSTYFSGSWGSFGNSDGDDLAAIRDASNVIVHDMAVTHPSSTINGPGSGQVTYFTGSSSASSALSNAANWTTASSTSGTPGAPNGGANTTWIQGIRPAAGAVPTPIGLSIGTFTTTTMDISWTKPSGTYGTDWDGVIIFVSDGSNGIDLSASGQDGIDYTANLAYSSGTFATDAGANDNAYCVANQTTDANGSITVTGLTTGTTYYVYGYTYKEVSGNADDDDFSSEVSGGSATPAALPSAGDLVISEIMYNSSSTDDEWIEIYNASGSAISFDGSWRLSYSGSNFDLNGFTINDGAYLTIAVGSNGDGTFNNDNAFTPDTNSLNVLNANVASTNNSNNLGNASETVAIIYDPSGANLTIDEVTYDDASPWPSSADGNGPSLTLMDLASDNSQAASWRASYADGGTPGTSAITELIYTSSAWNTTPNSSTDSANATVKTGESYSFAADAAVNDLTIEASATLTISSGNVLTVHGDIANNGSIVVESGASLVQTKASDANSGSGSYSVSRAFTPFNQTRFSYWSSPVSNANIATVFSASNPNDLYQYITGTGWSSYSSGTMNPGQGYAATPSLNGGVSYNDSKTFSGDINNGDVSITVNSVSAGDYILLGNPYPSAIDFTAFASAHSNIVATAYYWDASPSNAGDAQYASWNASGHVAAPNSGRNAPSSSTRAMQGFFVQVAPGYAGGNLSFTFTNAMRDVSGNTSAGFFKTETRERAWFNLSTDSAANQILIMLDNRASDGYDNLFDAPIYKANQYHSFYSMQDSLEYSIQGLPYVQSGMVKSIPLGVDAWYKGMYTISLDSLNTWDATNAIILVDSLNGTKTDLSLNDYQFNVNQTGVIHNRFYLLLGTDQSIGLEENFSNGLSWYQDANGNLVINDDFKAGFQEIEVRDVRGQLIFKGQLDPQNLQHQIGTESFSAGVYLIHLLDREQQSHSSKVMIKKF